MDVAVNESINAFSRTEWNDLFPGELEDWSYYRASEQCDLPGFVWRYFSVREHGILRAVVPAFITDYRIDTTLQGVLRRMSDAISRRFPRLFRIPLLSLGSPLTEHCHLGFASDNMYERKRWLNALVHAAKVYAVTHGLRMLGVKDAADVHCELWKSICRDYGLRPMSGLPTAVLRLPYSSIDDYLKTLGSSTRKDLRRKRSVLSQLRIDWRECIDDIIPAIFTMYQQTRARAPLAFEELTPAYFLEVLSECAGRAYCVCYWEKEVLVGFNLVLVDDGCLLDKFFGMDSSAGRRLNLYYISWLENIRYAIEHGLSVYQSGQGLHSEKVRLGSELSPNLLWYRHCNPVVNTLFAVIERAFRLDRFNALPNQEKMPA